MLLLLKVESHTTIITTASLLYLFFIFLSSFIFLTFIIKLPSPSPSSLSSTSSSTMFSVSNLCSMEWLVKLLRAVFGYIRVVLCIIHNLYCIPIYLLLTLIACPLYWINKPAYSVYENHLYYFCLYIVSGWSYGGGLVVHEHGEDFNSLLDGKHLHLTLLLSCHIDNSRSKSEDSNPGQSSIDGRCTTHDAKLLGNISLGSALDHGFSLQMDQLWLCLASPWRLFLEHPTLRQWRHHQALSA